jgi:hypothetical protein
MVDHEASRMSQGHFSGLLIGKFVGLDRGSRGGVGNAIGVELSALPCAQGLYLRSFADDALDCGCLMWREADFDPVVEVKTISFAVAVLFPVPHGA